MYSTQYSTVHRWCPPCLASLILSTAYEFAIPPPFAHRLEPRNSTLRPFCLITLRHAKLLSAFFERIYFRTLIKRYVRSSSTLPSPPLSRWRRITPSKSAVLFAEHASEVRPGFSVTPSTSPFQSRQCSTLVPVLVSHGMAANFDTTLLMRYLADRFFLFVRSFYYRNVAWGTWSWC